MSITTCNKEHIILALSQFGVTEIVGIHDNPVIINYLDELGYNGKQLKDETAWCSTFVNWVAMKSGLPRSKNLAARSWLKVGREVPEGKQEIGDVVIFWRGSKTDWRGHVGFYIGENENSIYTLGGNQSNQVKISEYSKSRLLGYRRLNSY
ncbi:TIGR02594 family protein [Lacinutrix sp. Hel_I_90]|uniref:TIGR02594 family protein n=1 Tax=Lacinutrix sp. Hel_I_90 TaxID=1249999 RepID=UPI0005C9890E|nr:TIGR02594 family protein [Lacinutrix sp. Hel_I_90]